MPETAREAEALAREEAERLYSDDLAYALGGMDIVHSKRAAFVAGYLAALSVPETENWERKVENRIHYRYGVNSGIYTGYPFGQTATHAEQRERLERDTSGPVDVTKRESRVVLYGPWVPVEEGNR